MYSSTNNSSSNVRPASLLAGVKEPQEDDILGYKILNDLARISKSFGIQLLSNAQL